jgi:competence protein ComEA
MLKALNNYFGFNRQQRNGLLVLLCVSFILLCVRIVFPFFIESDPIEIKNLPLVDFEADSDAVYRDRNGPGDARNSSPGELFTFDPNTAGIEDLVRLGFREKTAKALVNFRGKGFVFREKRDLLKVYGVEEKLYSRLEPHIVIRPSGQASRVKSERHSPVASIISSPQTATVELNSADSVALAGLPGIGPSFARRIMKYRDLLGGYHNTEQLKEVYGFTEELFVKVSPFVKADAALLRKINLMTADFKTVNKHPYLTYEHTKAIFDRRRMTRINATNLREILNDDTAYAKVLPYLTFD